MGRRICRSTCRTGSRVLRVLRMDSRSGNTGHRSWRKAMREKISEFTSPIANQQAKDVGLAFARSLVDKILVQVRAQAELKNSLAGKTASDSVQPAHHNLRFALTSSNGPAVARAGSRMFFWVTRDSHGRRLLYSPHYRSRRCSRLSHVRGPRRRVIPRASAKRSRCQGSRLPF